MLNKNKNKKGQGLIEIFAYLLALLVTMIFFILLNLPGCKGPPTQKISSENLMDLKMGYELNSYLRTPVEYEGAELTVADLMVLAFNNEEQKEKLVNEDAFSTEVFDTSEGIAYLKALDDYYKRDKNKTLTASTIQFMKAYAGFIPSAVSKSYYCSISVVAEEYDKGGSRKETIRVFDTVYYGFIGSLSCPIEFTIAEIKMPSYDGYISVQLKSKFNLAKLAIQTGFVAGPIPSALITYYTWH